jgi:4'-phosphopantetheinyl transferase
MDDIHLYSIAISEVCNKDFLDHAMGFLDVDELQALEQIRCNKRQVEYLATRALVRVMLSRHTGLNPKIFKFLKNQYGKPEILYPTIPTLDFSISHSMDFIICACVFNAKIGVDIENTNRAVDAVALANQLFSADEYSWLSKTPPLQQQSYFFDYWTLKESYIKAQGMGFSLPLESFSFCLEPMSQKNYKYFKNIHLNSGNFTDKNWHFWLLAPSVYKMAISLFRSSKGAYSLITYRVAAWDSMVPVAYPTLYMPC